MLTFCLTKEMLRMFLKGYDSQSESTVSTFQCVDCELISCYHSTLHIAELIVELLSGLKKQSHILLCSQLLFCSILSASLGSRGWGVCHCATPDEWCLSTLSLCGQVSVFCALIALCLFCSLPSSVSFSVLSAKPQSPKVPNRHSRLCSFVEVTADGLSSETKKTGKRLGQLELQWNEDLTLWAPSSYLISPRGHCP